MLMRTDHFHKLDRLAQLLEPAAGSNAMPLDAYRGEEGFVACFDIPGIDPSAIEADIEHNVLTVRAERRPVHAGSQSEMQVCERPVGFFSRQIFVGQCLDTEHSEASYDAGVLTVRIPLLEHSEPPTIEVAAPGERTALTG